jgi:UTP--glucose-1-phosphate uridylyltransferase
MAPDTPLFTAVALKLLTQPSKLGSACAGKDEKMRESENPAAAHAPASRLRVPRTGIRASLVVPKTSLNSNAVSKWFTIEEWNPELSAALMTSPASPVQFCSIFLNFDVKVSPEWRPDRKQEIGMKRLRKAVFPVAGLGTRFLPATKAIPKEMLTVVDRPVIQYVVDEAREAGIEHFIFVTGRNKAVIEDHFDVQFELYNTLAQRGKDDQLARLQELQPLPGQTSFTRQQVPLGLGHAVWCARDLVGDEPFALLLPDMIMQSERGCLKDMVDIYERTGGNLIAVQECDPAETHKYGIVGKGEGAHGGFRITGMVEKPKSGTAPSNLYINGRYILQPEIFEVLSSQETGAGNEIQLTDAMLKLQKEQPFYGYHFTGRTYDCGSPEGFVEANVAFALWRSDINHGMRYTIERLLREISRTEKQASAG